MKINITNIYGMSGQSTALIAQNETVKIAKKLDFHELSFYFYNIYSDSQGELNSRLDGVLAKLGYGDIVVYQSPTWNGREYDQAFIRKCKILNTKIITFIHDVPPLMFPSNYYLMPEYIEMYNQSDLVVVPSENMKERLIQEGLTVQKIMIQGMWDHVHDYPLRQPAFQKKLSFAGSVERFEHLSNWAYSTPLDIFSESNQENHNPSVSFKGWKTDPELLFALSEGGFGLVWGTSENPADEADYYRLNISHKVSTYLAAGIPVVVPSYLSNASFIKEKGLGYVVDSLEEASRLVEETTAETYQQMVENVYKVSYALKQGYFTKKLLIDAVMQVLDV